MNLTKPPSNATDLLGVPVTIWVCMVVPVFCVFLCCIGLMLHIFASHRQFRETSRYILFAFMLVVDTVQLLTSVLLFLLFMAQVKLTLDFCLPLLLVATTTFNITPLILAAMALERYVAIIYPLHCPAAWRSDRIWRIILIIWLISFLQPIIEMSMGKYDPSTSILCKGSAVNTALHQILFRTAVNMLFFAAVAVVIFYTYVRILLETKKLREDKVSVNKAMHTVLLHGAQLLLCVLAFMNPVTETLVPPQDTWMRRRVPFINFFCFLLFPRFLSPLIYGFRDQGLRGHMKKIFLFESK